MQVVPLSLEHKVIAEKCSRIMGHSFKGLGTC